MDQKKQKIRDFMASRTLRWNNLIKKPNNKKENNDTLYKKKQQARENFKRGANITKKEREIENRLKREKEAANRLKKEREEKEREAANRLKKEREAANRRKREREAENRRKRERKAAFRNTFQKLISNKKMTEKQAAIKIAKNLLGVNIPNKEILNRKVFLLIHPNRGNSNNRNIRTLVTSVLTPFKKD